MFAPKEEVIPLSSFKGALGQLHKLMNAVSGEIAEPKGYRAHWGIAQLSMNSPLAVTLENMEAKAESIAARAASAVVIGMDSLNKAQARPQYFNDMALESAMALRKLTNDGVASIGVFSNVLSQPQVHLDKQAEANITGILEAYSYYGSVDGRLEVVSGIEGQKHYFKVNDRISNAVVRCDIPNEMMQKAAGYFHKRVIVFGLITSNNVGTPRSIAVTDVENGIEVIAEEGLPHLEDIVKEFAGQTFDLIPYECESSWV